MSEDDGVSSECFSEIWQRSFLYPEAGGVESDIEMCDEYHGPVRLKFSNSARLGFLSFFYFLFFGFSKLFDFVKFLF